MSLLAQLERRIQGWVEGGFGRLFRGKLPPKAITRAVGDAVALGRGADGEPRASNVFHARVNPADHAALAATLEQRAADAVAEVRAVARRRGWVLAGFPRVRIDPDESVPPGTVAVDAEWRTEPGVGELDAPERHERHRLGELTTLGRHPACTITLSDPNVSGEHARIEVRDGAYWVEDLRSTNGTRVNGAPVTEPTRLNHEDVVSFGPVRYWFRET